VSAVTLTRHSPTPCTPSTLTTITQGWIEPEILRRTRALLERANLPVLPPDTMSVASFKELMAVDKKVQAGKLRLVLLQGPLGGCVVTGDFDPAKLDETLHAFCSH
jgi:3-dehydroquinate synthase